MNNPGQHGRQPTSQAAPLSDPRIRNVPANPTAPTSTPTSVTETSGICRDYLWGICAMGEQCIYRHELEFDAMKETLKFCHDHQNRTGCTRPDCTYLHTSRDEENLFLTTGQIPRVLLERYVSMSYPVVCDPRDLPESVPPNMNNMYEFIVQPPPPPPPPVQPGHMLNSPHQTQQQHMQPNLMINPIQGPMQGPMPCPMPSTLQGPMQGPMPCPFPMQGPMPCPVPMQGPMPCPAPGPMPCPAPGPIQGPMPGPMQGPMQHPMQGSMGGSMPQMPAPMQPPPPPPPPTSSVTSNRMSGPVYTGGHHATPNQLNAHYQPNNTPLSLPPRFDPTRPPPPIFKNPSSLKRFSENCEAGPSKLRKTETCKQSPCENCVQRRIRLELYSEQAEQVKKENEMLRAEVASRAKEVDRKKQLILSLMSPEMYRLAEDYVENGTPVAAKSTVDWSNLFSMQRPFLSQPNNDNNSSSAGLLNSLLGMIVGRESEPTPATSEAALLQQLTSRLRPVTTNGASNDLLSTLLELVRNSPTERSGSESRSASVSVGNGSVRSFSETVRPYERAAPSLSRPYEGAGPSPTRPYESAVPPSSRPYESAGPLTSRPYESAGPSTSRPYESTGPTVSRPYEGAGPSPTRRYDGAGPPTHPYDGAVASGAYTEMSMAPYEPVRYPPPASAPTAPANGQYHAGMELSAMQQGARPAAAPTVQSSGPGPYGSQQTQMQSQGPPSRPPFYVQMPAYNGANPPYPGMMQQQAGRPPMQPQQNPPNNFFFGTRYPNYYPPYQ